MLTMIRDYIVLATGCSIVGVVVTFLVLMVCARFNINVEKNLWVLAIPVVLSLILNVTLLEFYRKFRKRK